MLYGTLLFFLAAQLSGGDRKPFPESVQTLILNSTVLIVNTSSSTGATGVVIKQSGPYAYIMTAGHVVGVKDNLEVSTFSTSSRPKSLNVYRGVEVLARSDTPDLAVLRVRTSDKLPGVIPICSPKRVPEMKRPDVMTAGCGIKDSPRVFMPTVLGKLKVEKPGERESVFYWVTEQPQARGDSGGLMVGRDGLLIGIASGIGDGKGYYTHIDEIHGFLRRIGLRWIYEESP